MFFALLYHLRELKALAVYGKYEKKELAGEMQALLKYMALDC